MYLLGVCICQSRGTNNVVCCAGKRNVLIFRLRSTRCCVFWESWFCPDITLPEEIHYWSNQPDLGVSVVSEAMSSKQFLQIKRYFQVADNFQLQQGQKAAKVLPLYNALNENFVQFGWHSSLSIDESIVPYYG